MSQSGYSGLLKGLSAVGGEFGLVSLDVRGPGDSIGAVGGRLRVEVELGDERIQIT
ncbi:hypothetical protein SAMN04487914_11348 [Arthrobacter sp. ok909]|uniref:hypothetical protein n=1 Tax=Arthrobacter sp. ok909 TaxID=1761746 RepID=UPI0008848FDA|nr:hypothetical protein [Arthrobacter sp. ok909]SDP49119.1 hypothetical protein SAMN04487914_11348 [Arthrobacter sp. ok909]